MVGRLDLYRIFATVSQYSSFSKAAKDLYMTQSAVSQSISKLEKELDIQLFYRTPKGILLTKEGRELNESVRSALGLISAAEDKLFDFKQLKQGELRIGVGDTISRYFLLPYLEDFHTKYPGIRLKIMNGTTPDIVDFIKSGTVDVGICNLPIQEKQFCITPCKTIHDIFVCGEKYKRLLTKPVSLEKLSSFPLIFLENTSNSRIYVEDFFSKKRQILSPVFELGSYDLVMDFAKINLGISCVIKEFSTKLLKEKKLYHVPLTEEIPSRSIGIVHLKSVPLSRAATEFVKEIKIEL